MLSRSRPPHPGRRLLEGAEEAVRGADVVCLCTDSSEPVISL